VPSTSRLAALALACSLSAAAVPLHAQAAPTYDHFSLAWFGYMGDHAIANRLALVGDVQLRLVDFVSTPQQFLARAGLLVDVGPGVRAGGGYAYTNSYDYSEFTPDQDIPENRLWQQLNLTQKSNAVGFLHRFRLEERWLGLPDPAAPGEKDWTFQWRARYMLRATVPLHGTADRAGYLYGIGSNEIFIKWGSSWPTNLFDQNRFQLGLGVGLAKRLRLEATWLNLQLLRGDGSRREAGNGVALMLVSNASLR
jgi:hypothetical protein